MSRDMGRSLSGRSNSAPHLMRFSDGGGFSPRGAMQSDVRQTTHVYKLSGSCFKQAPLLISLMLVVWSMLVFRQHAINHDVTTLPGGHLCPPDPKAKQISVGAAGYVQRVLEETTHGLQSFSLRREIPQIHPQQQDAPQQKLLQQPQQLKSIEDLPSLTIFSAPRPPLFLNRTGEPQVKAFLSWLQLPYGSTPTKIVLLGSDPTFHAAAAKFEGRVFVEEGVDSNFKGSVLVHSILERAQAAESELAMVIKPDAILLPDIVTAMLKMSESFEQWALMASHWEVQTFPYKFPLIPKRRGAEVDPEKLHEKEREVRSWVRSNGQFQPASSLDVIVWNVSPVPLFDGVVPPFGSSGSLYFNWIAHEIFAAGLRQAVDASEVITCVHVAQRKKKAVLKLEEWEGRVNNHLAHEFGSFSKGKLVAEKRGTTMHLPWLLSTCREAAVRHMCLYHRTRKANCTCEMSSFVQNSETDNFMHKNGRNWQCGATEEYLPIADEPPAITTLATKATPPGFPHTMEQLLPQVAKKVDNLQIVILVAVTYGYAEMLMNFVCRLRSLGLADNLLVAALDEDLYKFSFQQGLPVYHEHASSSSLLRKLNSATECAFGSQCFRQFTKLKSRAVLRVLKAGFSVLWTDVDIVWYRDPLPHLLSFGPGTFPIQSNEPNASVAGTGIRRINSGFYFARASRQTVEAFEAITAHASLTKLSEQPSFYDVLCGVKGELLVPSKEECLWTNGLRTVFLDRASYPNGAVHSFWNEPDVTEACKQKGCVILHNNWISGKDAKKERMVKNGYWHYDTQRRMCVSHWHPRLRALPTEVTAENSVAAGAMAA
eukprot:TRINITY_DN3309_c0_g1_i1.p1 TRINITY_DN3309_c0_g1~~TRINITY_DN3309_c0_g1_i1.p1  ORF type:complete len:825 (-),score=207.10 TRINITY_DN3309_c0_g1_i1:167-2641(-)